MTESRYTRKEAFLELGLTHIMLSTATCTFMWTSPKNPDLTRHVTLASTVCRWPEQLKAKLLTICWVFFIFYFFRFVPEIWMTVIMAWHGCHPAVLFNKINSMAIVFNKSVYTVCHDIHTYLSCTCFASSTTQTVCANQHLILELGPLWCHKGHLCLSKSTTDWDILLKSFQTRERSNKTLFWGASANLESHFHRRL